MSSLRSFRNRSKLRVAEMSDRYSVQLQNFRSIKDATVELAPLTVIYGQNGSGKSSLIYGLLTLRNFLSNPNQNIPSLLSYPSISLGGIEEVVHGHDQARSIGFSIGVSNPSEISSTFSLTMGAAGGATRVSFQLPTEYKQRLTVGQEEWPPVLNMEVGFPYGGNQATEGPFVVEPDWLIGEFIGDPVLYSGRIIWNGLQVIVQPDHAPPELASTFVNLSVRSNLPMALARETGFVPLRRGFSKPLFNYSGVSPYLVSEDEVASFLASPTERFRQYEVSRYIEKIANRRVQIQPQIGSSVFTIDLIPTDYGGMPASVVNEGFGLNQLLYLLTICLCSTYKMVLIEEPEIHLHPTMVRNLAVTMAEMAVKENRLLVVSTHSEAFVLALLAQIASGNVAQEDVSFILAEKRRGETYFEVCEATPEGQLQGGLKPFMAGELQDFASLLGIDQST